jgi:RNA polymerase sigma factor (sigma-70 family)
MSDYEQILLQRFTRNRDAEAFSELVRHNAGLVYGTCVRILTDSHRAADVTQDTFFQLMRSAETITGSVSSWLHGVATKKAIDLIRRDSSRRRREAKYAMAKQVQAEKWDDISAHVDEALGKLDEQTRDILIQRFFKGIKMAEIGKQFGLSQPSISRRVDAGVLALRNKLRKRGIIVAAITLTTLLGESAVEAAPAAVLHELGKMAIVGGARDVAGAVVMSLKAKVVTAVAVAAVGAGTVVTYNVTRPPEPPRPLPRQTENAAVVTDGPPRMGMGGGMGGMMMGGGTGRAMMGGYDPNSTPVERE